MDLRIRGKRALVTGSTAGIGLATAAGLFREGASVVVNGRTPQRVEEAVKKVKEVGGDVEVTGVAADLSTAEGVANLVRQVPEVDILVNNLGIFEPKPFDEIPDEDWLRFFEVNVMSGVRLTRHYLPGMKARNWGRIVFVSSESAVQIPAEMIHYGMTKTAQLAIARGVAETVAGTGITVNSVLPGPTESEGVATFVGDLARQQGVGRSECRGRVLPLGSPVVSAEAVRHGRGGGEPDRLRVQPAGLGYQRGSPAGRWRRDPGDRLSADRRSSGWEDQVLKTRPLNESGDNPSHTGHRKIRERLRLRRDRRPGEFRLRGPGAGLRRAGLRGRHARDTRRGYGGPGGGIIQVVRGARHRTRLDHRQRTRKRRRQ